MSTWLLAQVAVITIAHAVLAAAADGWSFCSDAPHCFLRTQQASDCFGLNMGLLECMPSVWSVIGIAFLPMACRHLACTWKWTVCDVRKNKGIEDEQNTFDLSSKANNKKVTRMTWTAAWRRRNTAEQIHWIYRASMPYPLKYEWLNERRKNNVTAAEVACLLLLGNRERNRVIIAKAMERAKLHYHSHMKWYSLRRRDML